MTLEVNAASGFGSIIAPDTTVTLPLTEFNGTSSSLSTATPHFNSVSNSKVGTCSFWVKFNGGDGTKMKIIDTWSSGPDPIVFQFTRIVSNILLVEARDSSGTIILKFNTGSYQITTSSGLTHVMASWDTATSTAHIYVNGTSRLGASTTFVDSAVRWSNSRAAIGRHYSTVSDMERLDGCLGQFYLNTAEYVDLSNSTNRAKFYDATLIGNYPPGAVSLGSDGSTPTGTAPTVFLNNAYTDFGTNLGTGPDFTESSVTAC